MVLKYKIDFSYTPRTISYVKYEIIIADILPSGLIDCKESCPWERKCANHFTAGDFRTEDGLRPLIIKVDDALLCKTKSSESDEHGDPIDVDHKRNPFSYYDDEIQINAVLIQSLQKETDFQI